MTRISAKEARALLNQLGQKPRKEKGPLESEIQREIKDYLQWHGWFIVKIHQSLGSYKGIADLYALKNGRGVWIEAKTSKGVLSEHQKRFQGDVEGHGGEYIVARGIEDVEGMVRG